MDATLTQFNLGHQIFYSEPSFHLSLAWFLPPDLHPRRDGAKEEDDSDSVGSTVSRKVDHVGDSSVSQELSSPASAFSHRHPGPPLVPPAVISRLESSLSSVVSRHFHDDDDDSSTSDEAATDGISSESLPSKSSDAASSDGAALTAVWVKEAWLKTGNQLHSFPLSPS